MIVMMKTLINKLSRFAYYSDFWDESMTVTYDVRNISHNIFRLKNAYLELCKLIYLPFVYGYDYNCISQCTLVRQKILWDLTKVRHNEFETPYDISKIVEATITLSDEITDAEVSDSPYLHSKVDEYVILYEAVSAEEIKIREDALLSLKSFKQKKNMVDIDIELSDYLRVFMNTVTGSYRIAELIDSGQFSLRQQGSSVIVSSAIDLLSLAPMAGSALRAIGTTIDRTIRLVVQMQIQASAKNTVESFYNSEIEQIAELV